MHYPPETTSVQLIVRLLATLVQAETPELRDILAQKVNAMILYNEFFSKCKYAKSPFVVNNMSVWYHNIYIFYPSTFLFCIL